MNIVTIAEKKDEKFLRRKTAPVDLASFDKKTLRALVRDMKQIMRRADGVGLSANQIGLNMRLFVAEMPAQQGEGNKFYVIINPEIVKTSLRVVPMEEGCLSVPQMFGMVDRPDRITIAGFDANGKRIKIKAWGFLARVFQHEIDHLNGGLFIDAAKGLHKIESSK